LGSTTRSVRAYLSAARAEMLAQLGRDAEAASAYRAAMALTDNDVERDFSRIGWPR
jgi:RNA polymerase sigma-70 factor (ECF subfamily)